MEDDDDEFIPEEVEVPIDGVLDLHLFAPRDIPAVVADYLEACREKGILAVRLIHGKGTGHQKRVVEKVLGSHPGIRAFRTADERAGGWGATLVDLEPSRPD